MRNVQLIFLVCSLIGTTLSGCNSVTSRQSSEPLVVQDSPDIQSSPNDFYVIPGKKVGMVHKTSSEQALMELLGNENVQADSIYIGEGAYIWGTTLFKGTPNEAHIMWADTLQRATPEWVRLGTVENPEQSEWLLEGDLRLGSTLQEVEKANGKPFVLTGFDWDFGGTVNDWKGGKLSFSTDRRSYLSLIFAYDSEDEKQVQLATSVSGDNLFTSSQPGMYQLNPRVQSMLIRFK